MPRGRRVHSVSLAFTRARQVVGSFGFEWVNLVAPKDRRVHLRSRGFIQVHIEVFGFTLARLGVVGFIRVHVGSLGRVIGSSGSFWFAWVNLDVPRGHRVHSVSPGFTGAVVGFIRFCARVHSGAPRGHRVHSSSRGFTGACQVVVGYIRVRLLSIWRD